MDDGTFCKIPRRFLVTFLAFSGVVWFFAQRLNLSVAIVAMVNTVSNSSGVNSECPGTDTIVTTENQDGEFDWDFELQGIVLGAFFYGYFLTQLPGGILSQRFGGKMVFGLAVMLTSILALVSAAAARTHVGLFIFIRLVQGLSAGMILTSVPVILDQWVPLSENTRHMSFILSGCNMGVVLSQVLTGYLCASDFMGGWPSAFYVMGIGGMITTLLWMVLVKDRPTGYKLIQSEEKQVIKEHQNVSLKEVPWGKIVTSVPVWAICIAMTCASWSYFVMMSFLPTYMKQILHVEIEENGVLSSVPYIAAWFSSNVAGSIADLLIQRGILSTGAVRKILTMLSGLGVGSFTVAAGYTGCDVTASVVMFTLAMTSYGFVFPGVASNCLDIAPKYSGIVFAISNTFTNMPGFIAPIVVGYIVGDEPSQAKWRIVFWLSGGITFAGSLVFLLFASGSVQSWALEDMGDNCNLCSDEDGLPTKGTRKERGSQQKYGSTNQKAFSPL